MRKEDLELSKSIVFVENECSTSDALIYIIELKTNNLTFSNSYDMTIGQLISKTGGSHEIAIIYSFYGESKYIRKRYHQIPCPEL